MELIVFNFIIHLLSLILTISFSVYVYYAVCIELLPQPIGYLFLVISLIIIINLIPLLIKDLIYIKWKVTKNVEQRNKRIAENFLLKLKIKNETKYNTIFSDIINGKDFAILEEISEEEYKKYKDQKVKEFIDNNLNENEND